MADQIAIIGAGIGGLTVALALKQKGCIATVYESAPEIRPVGAGIVMASNAMQIFRKLGIQDAIEQAGNRISSMKITDERFFPLSVIELAKYEKKYGVHHIAIHRGELQRILAAACGSENIKLSKRLSKVERNGAFRLFFEDGTSETAHVVIGADGIKSTVRRQLFPASEIRDTGQVCWRGICEAEISGKYRHDAVEAWGKGKRFGFVNISGTEVYWYAVVSEHLIKGKELSVLFEEFHPEVLHLISSTPEENIFFSRIADLKPMTAWQDKRVCLIGDAAHATTPNLGQGACQAVEDAYVIGQLFHTDKPVEEVFAEYERRRIKKAHGIVNTSRAVGQLAHMENGLGIGLRNMLMRLVPGRLNARSLDRIFDIT
jgi:2-polyprenyl-6-methoxyphenol hydroxylase-like FAD-dependent oxidoreductase